MNREGSASIVVLSVLVFLTALFLGVVGFVELSAHGLRRSQDRDEQAQVLRSRAEATVQLLLSDPTPFADAPTDPVWSGILVPHEDRTTVELEDVSSRLGMNWVRKELLEDLGVLKAGHTAKEVQQFREDTGIHLELEPAFSPFIGSEDLHKWFTPYGWFNINVTDELVLRKLCLLRGADLQAAESFRMLVEQARTQRHAFSQEALRGFLGEENYRLLFPVVNAEPAINVHFIPERVLEGLFRHYQMPREAAARLVAARQGRELTQTDLQPLLGTKDTAARLEPFLGLKTWFWRITVQGAEQRLVWIVARLPREDGMPEFRRVEERLGP